MYNGRQSQYHRHRDALPDDSSAGEQRKVTAWGMLMVDGCWCCGSADRKCNALQVTAVCYANPEWHNGCGGQLRVWLPQGADSSCFPYCGTCPGVTLDFVEGTVDIAPLSGRVVIFLSGAIDHAVLPSHARRVAVSAWMT